MKVGESLSAPLFHLKGILSELQNERWNRQKRDEMSSLPAG